MRVPLDVRAPHSRAPRPSWCWWWDDGGGLTIPPLHPRGHLSGARDSRCLGIVRMDGLTGRRDRLAQVNALGIEQGCSPT
jgi:hypothetical protein